jgi:translation initiation factor 2 alpha subunit (eIF-2alpha)
VQLFTRKNNRREDQGQGTSQTSMEVKEDDLILCTVMRIEAAAVFVDLEDGQKGSIAMSEVAAGRIRNLREFVAINKKIVCKVLRKTQDRLELSLRRVTGKERDEVLEKYKKERTAEALLKAALKNASQTIENIRKDMPLAEFVTKCRADMQCAQKYLAKEELAALEKILKEKKEKEKNAKKIIMIKSNSPTGLIDIKEVLDVKNVVVHYLGSGKFSVSATAQDFKEVNQRVDNAIEEMSKRAKDKKLVFEVVTDKK